MKKWQRNRNYRKFINPDGTTRYVIVIDGVECEVEQEVYLAYSKADRRERYVRYEKDRGRLISLEMLLDEGKQFADMDTGSPENRASNDMLLDELRFAMSQLNETERSLIQQIYFEDASLREIARREGEYHQKIKHRRDRVLKKLKKYLKNFANESSTHPGIRGT